MSCPRRRPPRSLVRHAPLRRRPSLQTLEQKLVADVGPIARVMVRSAASRASGLDALCAELAGAVPEGTERESFRRDVVPLLRTRPLAFDDEPNTGHQDNVGVNRRGSIGSFHEPELERAQRALTQYVGPIARVLVRRAARETSSIDGLWQVLSMHVELPSERAAFLRQRHE